MATPKKSAKQSVSLSHPATYVYSCMANRMTLEREDGFTVAHFGLVNKNNLLIDRLTLIFPASTLETQKENLVKYSDGVGLPKKKISPWTPPVRGSEQVSYLPVVDFVHLCNWGDAHAEICFWSFSQAHTADMTKAAEKGKEPGVVQPWGIALLRCEIDLQRAFLEQLYTENIS